ncbi:hypothetical protein LTR47_002630 [Exophiala xenobiotica]|nr:hypothetical protein LTR72_005377 [Exophiala xenobiotica]KAK5236678.1 hypothetical protein LTR47_002630 [Exophiala xenobiotica]KAK5251299.1 hypothetical protein LTS06_004056 [Exophiala xenobiotica]KAK5289388.1 hypothetical protein LTR14_007640 [Exophiala xenobiotica]KAK5323461.1 hypothetical protein LTR93_005515 [Exophiala xenobiotica]
MGVGGFWHADPAEQIDFDAYVEEHKADFMPDDWRPPRSWFTKDGRRTPPEPKEAQPSTSIDHHEVDESDSTSRRLSPPPAPAPAPAPVSSSASIQAGQKRTFDELDDTANEDVAPEQEEDVDEDEEMIENKPTVAKGVSVIKRRKVVPSPPEP